MLEKDRQHFILLPLKSVYLKLGTKCNLYCKYCHQSKKDIEVNQDVFKYLSLLPNLEEVRLGGGEPLLYKDIIDKLKLSVSSNIKISMVSNGTLLTDNIIEWLNANDIHYGLSYDGNNNFRGVIPNFYKLSKVETFNGISTVITSKFNYDEFYSDIKEVMVISNKNLLSYPNFIHQTKNSPNYDLVDNNSVNTYISFICNELALEYKMYKDGMELNILPFLKRYIDYLTRNISYKNVKGVRCCNENHIHLLMNGNFSLCSYDGIIVGDIYSGVDWDKVNSYIPNKCKECKYWYVCRNHCIANITDNECKIFKRIYSFFKDMVGDDFAEQGI